MKQTAKFHKYPEVGLEIVVVSPKWKQKQEFKIFLFREYKLKTRLQNFRSRGKQVKGYTRWSRLKRKQF